MHNAIIHKQTKSSMQSGRRNANIWVLEYVTKKTSKKYCVCNWNKGIDTKNQIRITFESKEQAIKYAIENKISYKVVEETEKQQPPKKSYAENFTIKRNFT